MDIHSAVRREEDNLSDRLANGEIDQHEYHEEMKYLHDEARGALEEEAQRAYDDVIQGYR